APLAQRVDEYLRRSLADRLLLARGWTIYERAILRHHTVEQVEAPEDPQQIRQLAAGDQEQLTPGRAEELQPRYRRGIHYAVVGERPIVIGRQREIAHRSPSHYALVRR